MAVAAPAAASHGGYGHERSILGQPSMAVAAPVPMAVPVPAAAGWAGAFRSVPMGLTGWGRAAVPWAQTAIVPPPAPPPLQPPDTLMRGAGEEGARAVEGGPLLVPPPPPPPPFPPPQGHPPWS